MRDPTSDFALNARNGSALLRDVRERKEKMKMRKRFWELGGSAIGNAMGLAQPEDGAEGKKDPEAIEVGSSAESEGRKGRRKGKANGDDSGLESDEDINYKDGSSFAKHMKAQKNEAVSQFSKTKSIKEQVSTSSVLTQY